MTDDPNDPSVQDSLRKTAHALADAAGRAILPRFRTGLKADNKEVGSFDPVTEADLASERAMRKVLAEHRPKDAILGEEFGEDAGESGFTWVLDPIDGTRAFLAGAPTWGVLIAVSTGEGPVYGLIDQPFIGERFEGGFGTAAVHHQGSTRPLAVRDARGLSEAILLSTFPEVGSPAERAAFDRVKAEAKLTRYGLDCYGYALLALGQVDLVIEAGLAPYDVAAPIAVVQAAGGIVTDWAGGPAHGGGQVIAAANAQIHAEALALLREI